MLRAMGNWIYDKDPYEALQWTRALDDFKVPSPAAAPPLPCPSTTLCCGCNATSAAGWPVQSACCCLAHATSEVCPAAGMVPPGATLPGAGRADGCTAVQARLSSGKDVFGPLIKQYLLNNPHKVGADRRSACSWQSGHGHKHSCRPAPRAAAALRELFAGGDGGGAGRGRRGAGGGGGAGHRGAAARQQFGGGGGGHGEDAPVEGQGRHDA